MNKADILGKRFGILTVIEDSGQRKGNSVLWRCRCDCGGEILAVRHRLVNGTVQSCGCASKPARQSVTDLINQRFGMLTVQEDSGLRTGNNLIRWRCQCDCGGEILATRPQLVSGNVASCGCVPRQYASKRHAEDLTGQQFGRLTALRRAENDKYGKVCWLCRCSCGNEAVVQALMLKSGKTQSCGCKKHDNTYKKYDLSGRRFGRLTACYPVNREDRVRSGYWHCRCDCGNELDVSTGSLLQGLTRSCGCWNREQSGTMHDHMHYQDDTCLEVLKRSCVDTGRNKAGFRGLFLLNNGKYRASITFQGKHYDLGHYDSYARAVQARLDAEEILHKGYVKAFEQYETKAKLDPAWAEEHPFLYQVTRVNGDFQICTNGDGTEIGR